MEVVGRTDCTAEAALAALRPDLRVYAEVAQLIVVIEVFQTYPVKYQEVKFSLYDFRFEY